MQPKQTRKYKNWVNVHVVEEEPVCVNQDSVKVQNKLPYPENVVLLTADQEMPQDIADAKERELKSLVSNGMFEVIPFENQETVSSHWVISEKYKDQEN